MRITTLFGSLFVFALALGGCSEQGTNGSEGSEERRGLAGKADQYGSCVESCGGKSGSCWCDPGCAKYGDCCADSFPTCGVGSPPPADSCIGRCGGKSADKSCWCDDTCTGFDDCCDDITSICGIAVPIPEPTNTCNDHCGGKSEDKSCWCDDSCANFGDCCEDAEDFCGAQAFEGVCLKNSGDTCSSNSDCEIGGCTDQLCFNPSQSSGVTTCTICDDSVDPEPQGCGCIDGQCSWWQ